MPFWAITLVQRFLTEREKRSFNKSIFVKIIPKRERPGCFLADSYSPCFAEREAVEPVVSVWPSLPWHSACPSDLGWRVFCLRQGDSKDTQHLRDRGCLRSAWGWLGSVYDFWALKKQPTRLLQGHDYHCRSLFLSNGDGRYSNSRVWFSKGCSWPPSPSRPPHHHPYPPSAFVLGRPSCDKRKMPCSVHSVRLSVCPHTFCLCSMSRDNKVRRQRLLEQLLPKLEIPGIEHHLSIHSQPHTRAIYQRGALQLPSHQARFLPLLGTMRAGSSLWATQNGWFD